MKRVKRQIPVDPLTAQLARLFLAVDATGSADPMFNAFSDFWSLKRGGKFAPSEMDVMGTLPEIPPFVFLARLTAGNHS